MGLMETEESDNKKKKATALQIFSHYDHPGPMWTVSNVNLLIVWTMHMYEFTEIFQNILCTLV